MTAEVAIMNRGAVALAADSKVTVGSGGHDKTYDTVNKIFTLSKIHPIGIMIYGNAEFMEYPWETIIKSYRQKNRHSFSTVEEWGANFFEYLRTFYRFRKKDIDGNVRAILRSVFSEIEDRALFLAHTKDIPIPSDEFSKILLYCIQDETEKLMQFGSFFSKSKWMPTLSTYTNIITEVIETFVPKKSKGELNKAAIHLAGAALLSRRSSPQMSGIVIAGFGKEEFFPSLIQYQIDDYVGKQIKFYKPPHDKIETDNTASIMAFAQHEIVGRFMEGIDPGYSDFLRGLFRTTLIESNLETFDKWIPKSKKAKSRRDQIKKSCDKTI